MREPGSARRGGDRRALRVTAGGVVLLAVLASGCSSAEPAVRPPPPGPTANGPVSARGTAIPAPPTPVRSGPLPENLVAALRALRASGSSGTIDSAALEAIVAAGDVRVAWVLSDVLRFVPSLEAAAEVVDAFGRLTSVEVDEDAVLRSPWAAVTDLLLAWDLPAFDGYQEEKAALFLALEPRWAPFFDDPDSAIDWRLVSWGGVRIDDRPLGATAPCPTGCIPALDDPATTPSADGSWYDDDRIVFGVRIGDDAVALPRHQMEVHELVNLSLGGRRLAIPYCTLCGSAQAYLTDEVAGDDLVLRTSGLLSRSNKVMYDLASSSVLDTFTGAALSGPLHRDGVVLDQVSVVTSTWGAWKASHPGTRILARDAGIGRSYPDDPLRGRDDDGPIFPVGAVDPRLPVQEPVVGVLTPDGAPVAFPVAQARQVLASGGDVAVGQVRARLDGDGLRVSADGVDLPAHQAFWFAWSQFHPGTAVWTPLGG